ncbi:MAG: STAS domain-containing protein [Sandaracinus sp.]
MSELSAATVMMVRGVLVVQVSPEPTDAGVRELRERVGEALVAREVRGLAIDLARSEMMDTYLTRCVRDLAVGARLMGVRTVVCGLRPAVAETVVDMGMTLDDVPTARDLDHALDVLNASRRWVR